MASFIEILESGSAAEIESAVSERLQQNLTLFQTHFPKLYPLLTRPPKHYQLLIDEQGVNIVNLQNGSRVFPEAEGRHQMVQASRVLAHSPLNNPRWKIYRNNTGIVGMEEERFPLTGKSVNVMIQTIRQRESLQEGQLHLPSRFLPTTALLGLGGGLYLEMLSQAHDRIHSLLIFEESYDFFRISCALVDYTALLGKINRQSFFLFVEDVIDRKIINYFFAKNKITTNFTRLELSLYETPKLAETRRMIELEQASNSRGWGTFEDEMIGVRNSYGNIDPESEKLAIPLLHRPAKTDVPICVIGNGPSLDELLPFLRENQDKLILFSAGTALKPLRAAGIKPDFQIEIERLDYLPDVLEEAGLGDIPLLAANVTHPKNHALAKESYLFMRGSSAVSYAYEPKTVVEHSFPFVGNAAMSLALMFGNRLLLCGLDMGYKQGRTKHAKGSMYGEEKTDLPPDAVAVRGNFSDDIYADSIFALSREVAELMLMQHPAAQAYNLSDGAYVKGAQPSPAETLVLEPCDKQAAIIMIKQGFTGDASKVLGSADPASHLQKYEQYQATLLEILDQEVTTKPQFFDVIDAASAFVQHERVHNPFVGLLAGGSMLHLMHTMFIVMMHVRRSEVGDIYAIMRQEAHAMLESFKSRYRMSTLLRKME